MLCNVLQCPDKRTIEGTPSLDGGPLSSLNWLQKHLVRNNLKLSAGDIILGGTALGLYPVQPGDKIEVKVNKEVAVQCVINSCLI